MTQRAKEQAGSRHETWQIAVAILSTAAVFAVVPAIAPVPWHWRGMEYRLVLTIGMDSESRSRVSANPYPDPSASLGPFTYTFYCFPRIGLPSQSRRWHWL